MTTVTTTITTTTTACKALNIMRCNERIEDNACNAVEPAENILLKTYRLKIAALHPLDNQLNINTLATPMVPACWLHPPACWQTNRQFNKQSNRQVKKSIQSLVGLGKGGGPWGGVHRFFVRAIENTCVNVEGHPMLALHAPSLPTNSCPCLCAA